jgi:flagellar hook-associated protein 1 FlgK
LPQGFGRKQQEAAILRSDYAQIRHIPASSPHPLAAMSLFSSIQMASGALQANDVGLQVVGQNIANASTPGYLREVVNFAPGPTQTQGALTLGTGVLVHSITQQIDTFLETQLRNAGSDRANADTVQQTYNQLENIVGALNSGSNLTSAMNTFFSSIADVLNSPQNPSVRQTAVLQGQSLTQMFNNIQSQVEQLRSLVDNQVSGMAANINTLTSQIAQLNIKIAQTTGGGQSDSTAVGLTDQRNQAIAGLAKLIGIQANTQPDGTVNIDLGGSSLVHEGTAEQVYVSYSNDRGQTISTISVSGTNAVLNPTTGQLRGLLTARDQVLGGFEDQFNAFAGTLANEFNKVYSNGQGLTAYTQVTAATAVTSADASLDQSGLAFTPTNGSFQITVTNQQTKASTTTTVPVPLLGPGHTTTLNGLAAAINKINGLSAQVVNGKLSISASNANTQFSFGNDTSGTLAALGINTFFTGSNADTLGVNSTVLQDSSKFAASSGGVGADTNNAQTLANFLTQPLAAQNGATVQSIYNALTTDVTQSSANAKATADAADTMQSTLSAKETATSGVNLDDEVVSMLGFQQSYQASARYISVLSSLLTMLTQL